MQAGLGFFASSTPFHGSGRSGGSNLCGGDFAYGTPQNWSAMARADGRMALVPATAPPPSVTVGDRKPSGSRVLVTWDARTLTVSSNRTVVENALMIPQKPAVMNPENFRVGNV
ncbi:hypothetical protein DL768_011341 [Monosporascus sp. mg162]|nr:hypothetical protein DL768_011341 [Monosporascus sp. mg162]